MPSKGRIGAVPVRPARPDDLEAMARVLAAAFADYPWTRWTVDPKDHAERVRQIQRLYLQFAALPYGRVWVDKQVTAVAALLPPDLPGLPESVAQQLLDLHGEPVSRAGEVKLPDPPEATGWTLATAGVEPRWQGHGRGSAVIRAGLQELDQHGVGVHLETSAQTNLILYRRLGFQVYARTETRGPIVWSMWRAPTAKAVP